jgi:hypothetical protein
MICMQLRVLPSCGKIPAEMAFEVPERKSK